MGEWPINTIVLGYDGSAGAEKAVRLAAEVAGRRDAKVVVLTAYAETFNDPEMQETGRKIFHARQKADAVVGQLGELGIAAESDVAEGPAAEAIRVAAEVRSADLIVIGPRGPRSLRALLSRSTGRRLLRHAPAPVLVAR